MLAIVGPASTAWLAVIVELAANDCTLTSFSPYAARVAVMLRWMYGASSELWAGVTLSAWSRAG